MPLPTWKRQALPQTAPDRSDAWDNSAVAAYPAATTAATASRPASRVVTARDQRIGVDVTMLQPPFRATADAVDTPWPAGTARIMGTGPAQRQAQIKRSPW